MEEDENIKHDSKDLKPLQSKNSSSKDLHKKNITVKALRKDIKLKKKAQKKMVNLCLFSESELDFSSSQSESSSSDSSVLSDIRHSKKFDSAKNANAKFDFSLSDSSDSEKHSKEKQKKRKTKSGMSKGKKAPSLATCSATVWICFWKYIFKQSYIQNVCCRGIRTADFQNFQSRISGSNAFVKENGILL